MEDQKTHHNLLQLKPPSSSSSSSIISNHLSTPPDVDALLSLINHPTSIGNHHQGVQISPPPYDQLLPCPLISSHISSPSSLFSSYMMGGVGYGVVQESTEISPSCSALSSYGCENLGAARTHHAHLINSDDGAMGGKKRKMNKGKVVEKPGEVIHVRAKRGQATDSHSLAERVRRERINEKLRVLQDLVPGCYKTMGMAVMLDVIINYVRSLQNQIEFLSMKLSAASMFYDFNSPEAEAIEEIQKTNLCELREIERMMSDQVFEGLAAAPADQSLHSTLPL